jgi:nucleoid DNA-binding protein
VERAVGQRLRSGPGRPWRSPTRPPAAKGRDQLVLAVEQRAGLTFRRAQEVVREFWKVMQSAIRRGEKVHTPLGVFEVVPGPTLQKRTRWQQEQIVYRRPRRVVFRPSQALQSACNMSTLEEDFVPDGKVPSNQLCCEKCGSVYFAKADFGQYRKVSSGPGSEWSTATAQPIPALVCLCGHPIPQYQSRRHSILPEDWDAFGKSLACARKYRQTGELQAVLGRVAQSLVSREQYDRLAGQIARLEKKLRWRSPGAPESPDSAPPGTGS